MPRKAVLPRLWLITDARNDAGLMRAIAAIPRGSGLIYRHYHLPPDERRARFDVLARAMRARGGAVVLAGAMAQARRWGADGAYGAAGLIGPGGSGLRLMTAHDLRELGQARRARADGVLLSPVFPTRSHPGGAVLGALRFALMAARAGVPVLALGGMDARRAARLRPMAHGWAAIDGLSGREPPRNSP
ncbi:thiamine phosphate synthase [Novosphingobium ovatum]|nr:thiamine phosphate synthase [Novosphingobium ovatum]